MDSDTSRMTGALLLLLSLLLHMLLLLLIFLFKTAMHDAQHIEYIDLENQQPFDILTQQPQQQQLDQYDPDHEVLVELIAQGINPNDTLTQEAGEIVGPTPTDIPEPLTQEQTASDAQDGDESQAAEQETSAQETSEQLSETLMPPTEQLSSEDLLKGAQALEPIVDTLAAHIPQPVPKPVTPKQAVKKIVRKMAQRPPLTPSQAQALSKIAQGFMHSMHAELGGRPSNDPTQLAHQRYMTKLWNNLKQTMNTEHNVLALSNNLDTQATLVLTINKQGKLVNAMLRHPRKTDDILKMENMLLTNAHKVGLFPPLPESFKKEEVTFIMPIHLRALQGVHSGYRLEVEH